MKTTITNYLHIVSNPEGQWNLFDIALELCRIVQPTVDLEPFRAQVSGIAERVRHQLSSRDPFTVVNTLNGVLFEEIGFQGNREDYFNPENSYMTFVLQKKRGLPITLSVLYREIARRLDEEFYCVGMPGHFLLSFTRSSRRLFVDPFNRGEILLEEDCAKRMQEVFGFCAEFRSEFLNPVTPRAVVLRMLTNLKKIYRDNRASGLLLEVLERRIPIADNPLGEILERGLAKLDLACYGEAVRDLEYYVSHTPNPYVRRLILSQLGEIRRLATAN